jgi:hypothetical protein
MKSEKQSTKTYLVKFRSKYGEDGTPPHMMEQRSKAFDEGHVYDRWADSQLSEDHEITSVTVAPQR